MKKPPGEQVALYEKRRLNKEAWVLAYLASGFLGSANLPPLPFAI